ncbi:MAG: hypothetical protein ACHREM_18505 [Polyangiales bacterium]
MDDETLWAQFHACTLPSDAWTHRSHVRMAWLYRRRHPLDEAHVLMRVGIIKLNAAHALVETPERGYHETITRAWLAHVGGLMRETAEITDSITFFESMGDRVAQSALLGHYSRDRMLSLPARARFVEPDLAPLVDA